MFSLLKSLYLPLSMFFSFNIFPSQYIFLLMSSLVNIFFLLNSFLFNIFSFNISFSQCFSLLMSFSLNVFFFQCSALPGLPFSNFNILPSQNHSLSISIFFSFQYLSSQCLPLLILSPFLKSQYLFFNIFHT